MQRAHAPVVLLLICVLLASSALAQDTAGSNETFSKQEVMREVEGFFATTSKGLADLVDMAFQDYGRPNGFIRGSEASGAFIAGLRYGEGTLRLKSGQTREVYWQGPTLGFDWGGNAAKVFVLVYNLTDPESIYQRFPGVEGSAYLVGGFGMNYQRGDNIVLAPIRTGVGLRLGANIGYLHYTREKKINPF